MHPINKDKKNKIIPGIGRLTLRSIAVVASTLAIYDFLIHDWGRGLSFSVSWLLIIIAERRINNKGDFDR